MRALLFIFPWLLFNARSGCSLHGMIWFVFNIGLTWPSVASECAFKGDTPERFYDWQGEVVSLLNVSVQSACFMRTYQQMAQYARQITKVPHKRRLHWSSFDFFSLSLLEWFVCWKHADMFNWRVGEGVRLCVAPFHQLNGVFAIAFPLIYMAHIPHLMYG